MTLGNWFKDYVFYPISISKFSLDLNKKARKRFGNEFGRIVSSAIPILAVWLLTGIWHGPDWKYVTWGLFHGILIMLSMIFTPYNEKLVQKLHIKTECFSFRLSRWEGPSCFAVSDEFSSGQMISQVRSAS